MKRALLVSTYDLGHQPFGLASPAAWLRREGLDVRCADLSKEKLTDDAAAEADLIAFHLPMHTATRLAGPVIRKVRMLNPTARLCAYGLYAPLNEDWLRSLGVDEVLGGEFEEALAALAHGLPMAGCVTSDLKVRASNTPSVPKLHFIKPDRTGLLPLSRYATVHLGDGRRRIAGYTEASRGCRHLCRHCPVVPIYSGQFRVVQQDIVLGDIATQVAGGAEHITFGDPDFFNGPTHAIRVVDALHDAYPSLSYDVTIKVEHLLQHVDLLPRLRDTGCLFVTTAVESIDDRVLRILEKGHTRADFIAAVDRCRQADLTLVPTFVAFHPWISLEDYCDLLDTIAALDLVDHIAPIQLAIRLLIPRGSRLLELDEVRTLASRFDPKTLSFLWSHPDPRVDALQQEIAAIVGRRLTSHRREAFAAISALAHERAGIAFRGIPGTSNSRAVPYVDEPWYCCAEPNPEQLTLV
ncbi:MAG TPA: CUAEP/CCAEP-tail radical SAM protein [Vicinamibacterales bacterium]